MEERSVILPQTSRFLQENSAKPNRADLHKVAEPPIRLKFVCAGLPNTNSLSIQKLPASFFPTTVLIPKPRFTIPILSLSSLAFIHHVHGISHPAPCLLGLG
jgi:hypothetical protein